MPFDVYDLIFYAIMILGVSFIGLIIYFSIVTKIVNFSFTNGTTGVAKTKKGGKLVEGKLQGYRKVKISDGQVFEGNFKDGLLDGKGKMYIPAEKATLQGVFTNGELVDGICFIQREDKTTTGVRKNEKWVGEFKTIYKKPLKGTIEYYDDKGNLESITEIH